MNNTDWKGVPFYQWLQKNYPNTPIDQALEKAGIVVAPRFFVPTPFNIPITNKQLGAISQRVSQEILNKLQQQGFTITTTNQYGPIISSKDIWEAAVRAGVVPLTGVKPPRRVSAAMPRTADLTTYIKDPDTAWIININQTFRQMESNAWRRQAKKLLTTIREQYINPNIADKQVGRLWTFLQEWVKDVDLYTPSEIEETIADFLRNTVGIELTSTLRKMSGWLAAWKLSTVISGLVNLTQTFITTYPVLGAEYITKGMQLAAKAIQTRDPILLDVLRRTGAEVYSSVIMFDPFYVGRKMENALYTYLLAPFSLAEQFNRVVAALGAFAKAKDAGMPTEQAIEMARAVVARTQGDYSRTGSPWFLRGSIPSFLMQFKKFMVLYINFAMSVFSKDFPKYAGRFDDRKTEIARFIAASIMTGGALSLPFVNLFDSYFQKKYGVSPVEVLKEKLPPQLFDFLTRGIPGLAGVDISTRVGIPDIDDAIQAIIDNDTAGQIGTYVSPWANVIADVFNAFKELSRNPRSDLAVDKALNALLPSGMWYVYYAMRQSGRLPSEAITGAPSVYMTSPGTYSVRRGVKIMEVDDDDPIFWFAKAFGLRTTQESNLSRAYLSQIRAREHYGYMKDLYEDMITAAIRTGNYELARRYEEEAVAAGIPLDTGRLFDLQRRLFLDQLERVWLRTPTALRDQLTERARIWGTELTPPMRLPRVPFSGMTYNTGR